MRISKAGFNGKITSASMRTKAPTKNKDGERKPFKKKLNSRTQSFSSK